jgi:hypothetical protein
MTTNFLKALPVRMSPQSIRLCAKVLAFLGPRTKLCFTVTCVRYLIKYVSESIFFPIDIFLDLATYVRTYMYVELHCENATDGCTT